MPQNIFLLFAGISTLICAILFMIFCLCDLLERRQKRRREVQLVEQLVEQMLTPVGVSRYQPVAPPPRPSHPPEEPLRPARSCPPPVPPPPTGVSAPDSAVFGKPPCYEEAVLMEYPPPPYTAGPLPTPSEAENAGFPVQPSQPRAAALA